MTIDGAFVCCNGLLGGLCSDPTPRKPRYEERNRNRDELQKDGNPPPFLSPVAINCDQCGAVDNIGDHIRDNCAANISPSPRFETTVDSARKNSGQSIEKQHGQPELHVIREWLRRRVARHTDH